MNKQIVSLFLVLPILVMLAHDIIPHHHHDTHTSANFVKVEHTHLDGASSHCQAHESTQHLSHSHQENKSECCSFVNLRFFKDLKFQVYLSHIILDILPPNEDIPVKHYVSNHISIPEPYRESTGLRGPPRV
ncbi:hypothetical protein ACXR6G_06370 [Ancylomarina sp. YFZ004]